MPLQQLKNHNILLTNTSGVHAFPISETVFAMMLAFTRKIHINIRNQAAHEWCSEGSLSEVHGKTIGIIGVGSIGEEISRLAKAFGMRVLGCRRSGKSSTIVDTMFDMHGLKEMISECDYIVNALPSTKETYRLIGTEEFKSMKPNAFYINIGRGETTDTDALVQALKEKQIAGAGLDVFEQEPLPKEHPLWNFENVIITPHNSGATDFYESRAMDIFIENFKQYLKGKEPSINIVNLDLEY